MGFLLLFLEDDRSFMFNLTSISISSERWDGISSFLIVMDFCVSFLGYDTKSDGAGQAVKIRKKRMDDCMCELQFLQVKVYMIQLCF